MVCSFRALCRRIGYCIYSTGNDQIMQWFCFFKLIDNHLEFIFNTKEQSERWLNFWHHDPHCFVIEVVN